MLLALMDEAYTGTTIKDRGAGSGSDDSDSIDVADSLFLDLLKDENDGLAVCIFSRILNFLNFSVISMSGAVFF